MKKIESGIVFSYDIKRILSGVNSYDFDYKVEVSENIIKGLRKYFYYQVCMMFNSVTIVTEEEMLKVNNLIGGEYPHCIFG